MFPSASVTCCSRTMRASWSILISCPWRRSWSASASFFSIAASISAPKLLSSLQRSIAFCIQTLKR